MLDNNLLEMKLTDISDLLLERLCETGKKEASVELEGCSIKERKRMKLCVSLRCINGD